MINLITGKTFHTLKNLLIHDKDNCDFTSLQNQDFTNLQTGDIIQKGDIFR